RRAAQAVAASLQADDETIADQLVIAAGLKRGDILDAGRIGHRRKGPTRQECRGRHHKGGDQTKGFHRAITCTVPSAITVPLTVMPESALRTRMTSPTDASWRGVPEAEIVMAPTLNDSRTAVPRRTA